MKRNRILAITPEKWYVERHVEYLRRYLGDEFFIEIGRVPYPPYHNFIGRYPETSPFERSPDDYDLVWPLLPSHWHIDHDEYRHKTATVFYCPNEGDYQGVAGVGASTPMVEKACTESNIPFHSLRFGCDTNLFQPYPMQREDDLLHVGYIGTHINPRHMVKDAVMPVAKIPGVRLMIFPTSWINRGGNLDEVGGADNFLPHVVTGDVHYPGLPNIYNRLDVLLRMDQDPAYSFPTVEAAACGVPVIATNTGIDHLFAEAGAALMIDGTREYYMNNAKAVGERVVELVIQLRDDKKRRKAMGERGVAFVRENWTWDKHIPAWRQFFREALENASRSRSY